MGLTAAAPGGRRQVLAAGICGGMVRDGSAVGNGCFAICRRLVSGWAGIGRRLLGWRLCRAGVGLRRLQCGLRGSIGGRFCRGRSLLWGRGLLGWWLFGRRGLALAALTHVPELTISLAATRRIGIGDALALLADLTFGTLPILLA